MNRLDDAFAALRADLLEAGGPRISTMRNFRFAIVPYAPADEFRTRQLVQRLTADLIGHGWSVLSISLKQLLLDRIRGLGDDTVRRLIDMERRLASADRTRGLNYLAERISPLIEGPTGLAADCSRLIGDHIEAHPDAVDRTLALIGRAGSLYPFFRSSALLRHIDGRTRNVPLVLLYPGERRGDSGLSFMGELDPDRDYRPRIYP